MAVLMLGLGPVSLGSVLILLTARARSGGNKLLVLNLMKAFLIGIRPND